MRIISGKYKGKKIDIAKHNFRPTMSKVREAFFNILLHSSFITQDIRDISFLDLFCGTGIMGMEAISRGASNVVMIDIDTKFARENIKKLGCQEHVEILDRDILNMKSAPGKFDVIFIDPPYQDGKFFEVVLSNLKAQSWMMDNCIVALEKKKSDDKQKEFEGFKLLDSRKYGICELMIFSHAMSKPDASQ